MGLCYIPILQEKVQQSVVLECNLKVMETVVFWNRKLNGNSIGTIKEEFVMKLVINWNPSAVVLTESLKYWPSARKKFKVQMFFFYSRIWKSSKNQEDRRLPFLNISLVPEL